MNQNAKNPADLRKRLFRKSKPVIRPFTAEDMKWVWAAYKAGSFPHLPEMDQEAFTKFIIVDFASMYQSIEIVEDENNGFKTGFGPIAIVGSFYDGWKYEPHVEFFKWVEPRSILRCTVAYMQKTRYRKGVGVVIVKCIEHSKNLFDHVAKYGVLTYRSKIPNGDRRGDEYIYSTRGTMKSEETDKTHGWS